MTAEVHIQNGVHAVRKRQFDGRAAEKNDGNLLFHRQQRRNKTQLVGGQAHIFPVPALALGKVCKTEKQQNLIVFCGKRDGLCRKICFAGRRVRAVSARESIFYAADGKRIGVRNRLCRVYHGTARALIAHFCKKVADNTYFFLRVKRQNTVVFQ